MADGSTKAIQDIKTGDIVKSRDPATGKDENEPVIQTQNHVAPQVVDVHLSDGEKITCTPQHPFYVNGKGFEEAADLTTGDELSEGDEPAAAAAKPAPSTVKVDSIVWNARATTPSAAPIVYNFEVAATHTYFVGTVLGGVWVHNNCSGLGDLTNEEIAAIQSVVEDAGRPLEVGGSAASGLRRGIGSDLPIGKGPGTASDIDYIVPHGSMTYYEGLAERLPGIDPGTGIIPGVGNPYIGPVIRFEPGLTPVFVPGAE